MIAFKVVTPKGEYLKQDVKSVHVKTVIGETTILPNHMPIFASLVPCKMVLKDEQDQEMVYALAGGFLQFDNNQGMILADAIEGKEEIDLERAKQAMQRAKERLEKKDSKTNLKRAELSLARAVNRIHVYGD
jgi:F-type H+-transporting ATPase subunit epsilon